jgi:hypothetical protein
MMFHTISLTSLAVAFLCGILIAIDEIRYRQKMWIMNLVWPLTALYFSIYGLWFYFRAGPVEGQGSPEEDLGGRPLVL